MGEGGFGRVFRAAELPSLPGVAEVAIKKGSSVHSDSDLNDLHHEVRPCVPPPAHRLHVPSTTRYVAPCLHNASGV